MHASIAAMRRRQLPGEAPPPTKSELKRRAQAVQDLANRLIEAPEELIAGLALPDKLADALALARRLTSHGARLRQRLFVGKLLRGVDAEPIRAALDADAHTARVETARFRRAERWRDDLITRGAAAIADFMAEFPDADGDRLAALITAAAQAGARQDSARRELFRLVRQQL
ncbi:MAG: ribosome biogenesis factor YjgA [Gammaproteobacteria bacterium]